MSTLLFDSVQEQQLRAVATSFLRLRPWIVAPALVLALLTLDHGGAPRAQLTVVSGGSALMVGFFSFEAWLGRRRAVTQRWFFGSLLFTLSGIAANCAATGGVRSPMLPLLFAPLVIAFSAFGRSWRAATTGSYGILLMCLLALLPSGVPFAAPAENTARVMTLAALLTAAVLLWVGVSGLTDALGHAGKEVDRLRERALDALSARAHNLEALTQNLAHELKNPLSSIKGLAQLLAGAELAEKHERRREVLLTEVARAEQTLKDYLSFSRPLQRLELAPANLSLLVSHVLALLQARADVAGVTFEIGADRALAPASEGISAGNDVLRVDRARLEEALVNLVANAVEASASGAVVKVTWDSSPDGIALAIHNDAALPTTTLERLGTPFFTTKQHGTGLGVVLARNIISQHGGSLDYTSSAERGTVATVTLPRTPGETS